MLTLYTKSGCPFSAKVALELSNQGLEFERKNIKEDEAALAELMDLGGKKQTPYLFDGDAQKGMYESDDIIRYIKTTYGNGDTAEATPSRPRVHISDSACISCEG